VGVKSKGIDSQIGKLIADAQADDGSGGTTDGLNGNVVYTATIKAKTPDCDGEHFHFESKRYGGNYSESRCWVYKIQLNLRLGASDLGYEVIYNDTDEMKEAVQQLNTPGESLRNYVGKGITEQQFENLQWNLLPEGVYVEDSFYELPAVGDQVYATGDGGIEGRYLIEPKAGRRKSKNGGYAEVYSGKPGSAGDAKAPWGRDEEGKPIKGKTKYDQHGGIVTDSDTDARGKFWFLWVQKFLVPGVVRITSDFGKRSHPKDGKTAMHFGVDIAVQNQTITPDRSTWIPVLAPVDGTVTRAMFQGEENSKWKNGNNIILKHDGAHPAPKSQYLHLMGIHPELRPYIHDVTPAQITDLNQIPINQLKSAEKGSKNEKANNAAAAMHRIGEERAKNAQGVLTRLGGAGSTPWKITVPVKKGQILGWVGNSGRSFGAHLHFQCTNSSDPYKMAKKLNEAANSPVIV